VKEAIFHPEARAEMNESFDFYEARLDGLGLRLLLAVEQTVERISTHPEAGAPLAGEFRKRIVPGFPYTSSIVFGKIIFTSLLWLIIVVVQVIGANEPIVANDRLKNDARSTRAS
jgi:hypothetical protein